MARFLIVAPAFDADSSIAASWAEKVAQWIEENSAGHEVHRLVGGEACRSAIEHSISGSDCVVYYGHGHADSLCAHPGNGMAKAWSAAKSFPLNALHYLSTRSWPCASRGIDAANIHLLSGRFVYAVACSSALRLGRQAEEAGVAAYLGYSDEFLLVHDFEEWFGRCANAAIMHLTESTTHDRTVRDGYDRAIREFSDALDYFERGPGSKLTRGDVAATYLAYNRFRLAVLGNPDWSLTWLTGGS